tara:strand:+ start:10542 stop:10649 length:108 start_codon:yes stop_codon:yes gene_type:complete
MLLNGTVSFAGAEMVIVIESVFVFPVESVTLTFGL